MHHPVLRRALSVLLLPILGGLAPPAPAGPASGAETVGAAAGTARAAAETTAEVRHSRERPDLVFISFDTTRRDHVSAYGHERLTTPTVDRLAREGALFTNCQAVIPVTGPSHVTLFTGLYPQTHGAFRNGVPVGEEPVLLGDLLRAHGYRSHASVAGWTLKDEQCGLGRGFDSYDEDLDERVKVVTHMRRADAVTDAALGWYDEEIAPLGDERPPVFLFVHYFDPHEPYDAPSSTPVPGPNPAADGGPALTKHSQFLEEYDREIAFTDAQTGRLLDGLRERGLLEEAIVVFTADHGQAFGEHGEGGPEGKHGRKAYQSTLAAPLVVWAPGFVRAGTRIDLPVSHVDLLPTLASLTGVPWRSLPANLQGHDLSGVLLDPAAEPPWGAARRIRHGMAFRGAVGNKWNLFRFFQNRDVDDSTPLQYAVLDGDHKVLVRPKKPERYEVYDLAADPGELRPLKGRERERFRGHVTRLADWFDRTCGVLEAKPLTAEQEEALRSLGYLGN